MVYKLSFESGEAFPSQRKIGPIKPGGKFFIKMGILRQYYKAFFVALSAFVAGTVMSWNIIGGTEPTSSIKFPVSVVTANATITIKTEFVYTWLMRLNYMGAMVGAMPAAFCAQQFGRRITILLLGGLFIFSWVLKTAADMDMLISSMIVGAVAIGSISILTPMYLTEIADDDNRGGTGSLYFSMFTFGKIFMLALRTVPYIWYTCAPLFFPPLSLITVALAPESPSYLLYCQKFNKAKKSFLILRPEGNPRIKQEYQALEAEIEILKKKGGGFKQIFTKAPRKAFMISFFLMIFYGLCGSSQIDNFIIYFYEDNLYYILSFVNLLIQAVFSVVGGRLSDTIGRKIMLIVSAVTMAISLTVMGVYYRFGDEIGSPIPAQVFVFVFIFGYSIGFGPLPWTIVTELFPINIKWFGSSIVILVYWLVEFLFHGIYADELISLMGIDCFAWTVAGICCLSVVFIIFCLPETKGLSDGEIRQLISSKVFHHWRRHNAWNLNG